MLLETFSGETGFIDSFTALIDPPIPACNGNLPGAVCAPCHSPIPWRPAATERNADAAKTTGNAFLGLTDSAGTARVGGNDTGLDSSCLSNPELSPSEPRAPAKSACPIRAAAASCVGVCCAGCICKHAASSAT